MSYPLKPGMSELFRPAKESSVVQFEKDFGYRLPNDYRVFLTQLNGASIEGSYCFSIRQRWIAEHIPPSDSLSVICLPCHFDLSGILNSP